MSATLFLQIAAGAQGKQGVPGAPGAIAALSAFDSGGTDKSTFEAAQDSAQLIFVEPSLYSLPSEVLTTKSAWFVDPTLSWEYMGGANLHMGRGFYTTPSPNNDSPNGANIWRFADRVFIGRAAWEYAGNNFTGDIGTSHFSGNGSGLVGTYLPRDATLNVFSVNGAVAINAAVRSSDNNTTPDLAAIGYGCVLHNDKTNYKAWGAIYELQHEAAAQMTTALEIDVKNMGANKADTPYSSALGAMGLWLCGGGYGNGGTFPYPVNPSNAAIVVLGHYSTWNKGLIFKNNGLTVDGNGLASMIEAPKGYSINWYTPGGDFGARIYSAVDDYANRVSLFLDDNSLQLFGAAGRIITARAPNTGVNYLDILGGAAGSGVQVSALGDDTNIALVLSGKGSGGVYASFANGGGLRLLDSDNSHTLGIRTTSNLTANRLLTFVTSDADRTLTLSGNLTVNAATTISSFGASLVDDADADTARDTLAALGRSQNLSDLTNVATALVNLGIGTLGLQSAASVAITGGSISGITDLAVADGGTGASAAIDAQKNLKGWYVLATSAVAVSTTSSSEAALATVTVPANAMGPNGQVRVTSLWSFTNSTNTKTIRTRFGGVSGTQFLSVGVNTSGQVQYQTTNIIRNRNNASSQVGAQAAFAGLGASTASHTTSSVDTNSAVDIVFSGQTNGSETVTLESYTVEIIYGA